MSAVSRTYVICTTARSGSNLVCDYLDGTGRLGRPAEFLNPDIVRNGAYGKRFPFDLKVSLSDYLSWLKKNQITSNGIFGIKLLYEDFEYLGQFTDICSMIRNATIVRLTRRKKLSQAISYFMAVETGQWIASDPGLKPPDEVEYDQQKIERYMTMLARQDASWDTALDCLGCSALHWSFESFVADPSAHISSLAAELDVNLADVSIKTALVPQATETSRAFLARYRSDYAAQQRSADSVEYEHLTFDR
ncbi:hypothetical protein J5Y09_04535 [Roseomonas sp. PWR1]|uniref:Sulphotransferase Stf0 domain-containing protein n=1 Tax=Roseomonas nitratireducens TaxID=2820810 RepID=A0ABS4AQN8_9PROT|nr:Stf0 family sulfotransferase [Neoroseomonas nitratireducens]MBP0463168.1 hypothetical protein [Neoroseomonas nitratireducens]